MSYVQTQCHANDIFIIVAYTKHKLFRTFSLLWDIMNLKNHPQFDCQYSDESSQIRKEFKSEFALVIIDGVRQTKKKIIHESTDALCEFTTAIMLFCNVEEMIASNSTYNGESSSSHGRNTATSQRPPPPMFPTQNVQSSLPMAQNLLESMKPGSSQRMTFSSCQSGAANAMNGQIAMQPPTNNLASLPSLNYSNYNDLIKSVVGNDEPIGRPQHSNNGTSNADRDVKRQRTKLNLAEMNCGGVVGGMEGPMIGQLFQMSRK